MVQNTATSDGESPEIGSSFVHQQTRERVEVVEHMFRDRVDTPFVVRRESDSEEIGFETPEQFFSEYESERTETKRFDTEVSADGLIEGDRIARQLVATVPGQLGQRISSGLPDAPKTQLLAVTEQRDMDDSHTVLVIDPETETWIRATRIKRNQARTQAEADWTVRELGDSINVTDVDLRATANEDAPEDIDDPAEWVQSWVDVLFGDIAAGYFDDYDDRRRMDSARTLRLEDEFSGALAYAEIELVGENSDE